MSTSNLSTKPSNNKQQESQPYDFVFRTTGDGILITDSEGFIREINPAAAALLVVVRAEVLGKTAEQCFNKNPALINLFTRVTDQTLEVRLPRRRLATGVATSLSDGRRVVLLQDVTEKRELESRRESLISTMTHDLRNPLSAVSGFAELVSKFGTLNEQQEKFMTRIRQTTTKMYDVVGSLVDLAWIEAGMPMAHQPIRLEVIINEVVFQLSTLAMERKNIIAVSVQNPMPEVMGDPMRMRMVIYNLLHNAILYSMPEQTVAIHAWGDTNEVYCSVADRGIGIADDEIELIFDRMYRSKDERVRNLPGGGLGLTMTKTIIKRHGGDIWASSNLGEGSTFTFVLPTVRL